MHFYQCINISSRQKERRLWKTQNRHRQPNACTLFPEYGGYNVFFSAQGTIIKKTKRHNRGPKFNKGFAKDCNAIKLEINNKIKTQKVLLRILKKSNHAM